ncbi:hypothetical protein MPTK1_7g09930 [Marchantia polymorpha subsp. ruderalis]|uniref:Uncharacterized protein n=2 Tax=Marchantia polymorpha TaxID=3197 RepID=A0AAF6BXX7_MARPO|nr:hypothetical protein MARPO_0003s0012 [Marchantia polymorpha]BBN16861.1 hypothetical protein Mp_7g09930 [Marchantia polymorpha subsp. ruderalis]|eukprot:PTQ49101.1 hypothetical protein MARPO_0003s0012 [Marchantia polymorpha]
MAVSCQDSQPAINTAEESDARLARRLHCTLSTAAGRPLHSPSPSLPSFLPSFTFWRDPVPIPGAREELALSRSRTWKASKVGMASPQRESPENEEDFIN